MLRPETATIDYLLSNVFGITDPMAYAKWRSFLMSGIAVSATGPDGTQYLLKKKGHLVLIQPRLSALPPPPRATTIPPVDPTPLGVA